MERHLNVFYAYSQGSSREIEEEKILEDNVTRALIITLSSSQVLTRQFLRKFLGAESTEAYEYRLQTTWQDFSGKPESDKGRQSRFVLGISPEVGRIVDTRIPQLLLQKVKAIISDKEEVSRRKLQNLLSDIGKERKHGQVESSVNRLEALLGGDAIAYIRDPQFGDSNLRYLYDLTLGSRPDALIADKSRNLVVLLENKIHGGIVGVQIERHIRENFGEHVRPQWLMGSAQIGKINEKDSVPVRICGWRTDIYPFIKSFQEKAECHDDAKVSFLVAQFLQYLEVIGMGEIKFNREDFLEWESYKDPDYVRNLLDRVENLGQSLVDHLGEHWVNRQNISRNYLGVNIMHNRYEGKGIQPVNVPHWSLAIQQHGAEDRCLRLFIQCESKKLGELVLKNKNELQRKLAATLQNARRESGIFLRVMEKSHLIQGGRGKNEGVWNTYFSFPLELCVKPEDVERMVTKAFEAMTILHTPHVQKERVKNWPNLPALKGKTIVGVLQLNYQFNWLELEKLGIAIPVKLERMVDVFRPFYDVLLEVMPQAATNSGELGRTVV